jgi:hypothetical protein
VYIVTQKADFCFVFLSIRRLKIFQVTILKVEKRIEPKQPNSFVLWKIFYAKP